MHKAIVLPSFSFEVISGHERSLWGQVKWLFKLNLKIEMFMLLVLTWFLECGLHLKTFWEHLAHDVLDQRVAPYKVFYISLVNFKLVLVFISWKVNP